MTNKEIESYRNSYKVVNGIGFCRVNNDINGNPRYVVHFLAFTSDEEMRNDNLSQSQLYAIAKKCAIWAFPFIVPIGTEAVLLGNLIL
jgi:hypothetical protein